MRNLLIQLQFFSDFDGGPQYPGLPYVLIKDSINFAVKNDYSFSSFSCFSNNCFQLICHRSCFPLQNILNKYQIEIPSSAIFLQLFDKYYHVRSIRSAFSHRILHAFISGDSIRKSRGATSICIYAVYLS